MTRTERDAWEGSQLHRVAHWVLILDHLLILGCALAWFISPSASIDTLLDPGWSASWSLGFGLFAVIAIYARMRSWFQLEAVCTIVIAISLWLWAVVILYVTVFVSDNRYGGLQTGLMFLAAAAYRWGFSLITISWTNRAESERARFKRLVAAEVAERVRLELEAKNG